MFVRQQTVSHISQFSQSASTPSSLHAVSRRACERMYSRTYLHARAHILPLKKKKVIYVFQKGHIGETQHTSFSQSERYSGGRGQHHPTGQFTALLWEFHMIQVWEWRVGKAGAVTSPWQFYFDRQIKRYLLF